MKTQEIQIAGLSFTVDIAGPDTGKTVLFLHGFPETRHMWRHQLRAFSDAGYRAFAPDQRGYSRGARPQPLEAYATDRLVGDALGLMDAVDATRFHLVGHDWGGQLAWLIAARQPERLLSLSILSRPHPAAFSRAMQEDTAQASRSQHHRAFREADAIERMRHAGLKPLRDALQRQGVAAADVDVYIRSLSEEGAIEGAMNWYRASTIALSSTPSIGVPTLYVWGDQDETVGRRAAELTAEYVKGPYRFVTLEGAGHFLVDQFPDRVTPLLIDHVATNP